MSKVNQLFERKLSVVNFGIESFYQDLIKQGKSAVHVDWKPVAGGDKKIAACLRKLRQAPLSETIAAANQEALRRILAAQPVLVGMSTAGEAIPGMTWPRTWRKRRPWPPAEGSLSLPATTTAP